MTPFIAGIQHQYMDDGVENWTVAGGWAWVKCIGFSPDLARLRQRMPDTKFIYRPVLDETRPPSRAVADEVVADCEAHPGFDVYEGINEGKILWEYADAANAMEANIAERLKANGMNYIAVCFPTGNPPSYYDPAPYDGPGGLWENGLHAYMEHYRVAVETAKGLNCHAYHKPGEGNDPRFHEYRWQMFPDWARRRGIYVTEAGWDGGGAGKGFRAYTDLPTFLASAREMHNVAAQGGCKAWVLFGGAMRKPWGTFALYGVDGVLAPQEQRDAVVRWCRALREHSQQGDVIPMPTELALHGRAATMAWKHGDISEVLTPPQYIIPGICFMQATQLRTYFWYGNDPAQPSIDIGWSVANDATMGAGDSFLPNPKA